MPQLNPSPWFFILLSLWFLFILIVPTKVTQFQHLNDPSSKPAQMIYKSWPWPWI